MRDKVTIGNCLTCRCYPPSHDCGECPTWLADEEQYCEYCDESLAYADIRSDEHPALPNMHMWKSEQYDEWYLDAENGYPVIIHFCPFCGRNLKHNKIKST